MDLIGSIQYIENRLGERRPGQGKSAPKSAHHLAEEEQKSSVDDRHTVPDYDAYVGRVIDTMA